MYISHYKYVECSINLIASKYLPLNGTNIIILFAEWAASRDALFNIICISFTIVIEYSHTFIFIK